MSFFVRRRISWVFIAWVAAGASLFFTSRGGVCEDAEPVTLKRYDPTTRTISALIHEDDPGLFILVRYQGGQWQKDVGVGDDVVSFSRLFLDRRMRCQFVFVDDWHWFGVCAVYPWQGDSRRDVAWKSLEYRTSPKLDVYFIGSSRESCRPILLRTQVLSVEFSRNWESAGLYSAVALEMAEWEPSARRAVHRAVEISPSQSNIHRMLSRLHGLESGWHSTAFETDALVTMSKEPAYLEEIPAEIQMRLSGEQLRGMEDFFDDKVLAIP